MAIFRNICQSYAFRFIYESFLFRILKYQKQSLKVNSIKDCMASIVNGCRIGRILSRSKREVFHTNLQRKSTGEEGDIMEGKSIHSGNIKEVHLVPMRVIMRPLIPTLDEKKVLSLMDTLSDPEQEDKVPPIDILWVKGREGGDYYFSFGGCHRYEAFKRLERDLIPCKIVKSTVDDIKVYLGSSMPDLK